MPGSEYEEECAMITEEILRQRIEGMKGPDGVTISPTFPKLVYALDEHNAKPGSKYYYLTKLAAECTAKRMMPDYVSAKIMRKVKDGQVFGPMGCRSFLSVWYDKENNPIIDGRFNKGVVTLNLPQCAIVADGNIDKFWKILDERLELCHKALKFKTERLLGVKAKISPLLWMYGCYARKDAEDTLDDLMVGGYSTLSLGYIGLYETIKLLTGESNTKHQDLALKITKYMADKCFEWNTQENYGYSLYSTPAESLCYRFAKLDKEQFGEIKDVTDKGYYTNSHHIDVRENINIFDKIDFEAPFQENATGGFIGYGEIPNMTNNIEALETIIQYIYDHAMYWEFNTKLDHCMKCGFNGEILPDGHGDWICPKCGNQDHNTLKVIRRT